MTNNTSVKSDKCLFIIVAFHTIVYNTQNNIGDHKFNFRLYTQF